MAGVAGADSSPPARGLPLQASAAQGAPVLSRWVPQPVACGSLHDGTSEEHPALVVRARSGFAHTPADVRAAYPDGVDARHAVWMRRRLLDLLGWVHRAGWAHARGVRRLVRR